MPQLKWRQDNQRKVQQFHKLKIQKHFTVNKILLHIMYCKIFGFVDSHLSMSYLTFAILYQINAAEDLASARNSQLHYITTKPNSPIK